MLHVVLMILVYATPVDDAHHAGANGQMGFYHTTEECQTAAVKGGRALMSGTESGHAIPMPGEKVLGAVAMCIGVDIPTSLADVPVPPQPLDIPPGPGQNRSSL